MRAGSTLPAYVDSLEVPTLYTMHHSRMAGDALVSGRERVARAISEPTAGYQFHQDDPIRGVYAPARNEVLVLGRHSSDLYLAVQAMLRFRGETSPLMAFESVVLGGEFITRAPVVREAVTTGVRDHAFAPSTVELWREGGDVDGPNHLYRIAAVCRVLGIPAGSRARFEWADNPDYAPDPDPEMEMEMEMEALLDAEGVSLAPKRFDGDLEQLYREIQRNGDVLPAVLLPRRAYRR